MNGCHLLPHASCYLSHVSEHAYAWFGLVDAKMRTQGCSSWPPLFHSLNVTYIMHATILFFLGGGVDLQNSTLPCVGQPLCTLLSPHPAAVYPLGSGLSSSAPRLTSPLCPGFSSSNLVQFLLFELGVNLWSPIVPHSSNTLVLSLPCG
jgi:hypothetical protein